MVTENILKDKVMAIIWGGPGGLALAKLWQSKVVNVKVYERDYSKDARVQGAIIDLHYDSGLKVPEAAGLMDSFKANYMPGAEKYRMVGQNGKIWIDKHGKKTDNGFGDERFRPEMDRGALRNLLLASLQPGTAVWYSQFKSMTELNNALLIEFKTGKTAYADVWLVQMATVQRSGHTAGIVAWRNEGSGIPGWGIDQKFLNMFDDQEG